MPDTDIPSDLAPYVRKQLASGTVDLYAETLEQMERFLMTRVFQHVDGNQTKAAKILGITRGKVRDRVKQFGISLDKRVALED